MILYYFVHYTSNSYGKFGLILLYINRKLKEEVKRFAYSEDTIQIIVVNLSFGSMCVIITQPYRDVTISLGI